MLYNYVCACEAVRLHVRLLVSLVCLYYQYSDTGETLYWFHVHVWFGSEYGEGKKLGS